MKETSGVSLYIYINKAFLRWVGRQGITSTSTTDNNKDMDMMDKDKTVQHYAGLDPNDLTHTRVQQKQ